MESSTKPLDELIAEAKAHVTAMSPEQKAEMIRKQGESWMRAELQWAKDFREGRCKRD